MLDASDAVPQGPLLLTCCYLDLVDVDVLIEEFVNRNEKRAFMFGT